MYKKIVQIIIDAVTEEEMNHACGEIDRAFQAGKITWNDNEQLYDIVAKVTGWSHGHVKPYKG